MKLPFLSLFKKPVPTEYFLAFLLRDEQVHAVVFEEVGGRMQVIGQGKADLPESVENISDEALLSAADKAISYAEENLPEGIQTHKTVFGVKESWVEESHISKEYLAKLKHLSDELDLQPIGFLVFPEAIAHMLQKEEGAPVSGILIDAGNKQVTLTLIRAGRIAASKQAAIGSSLLATVEETLSQFENVEIFPSRIIFLNSSDSKNEHAFLTHHWSKSLPFLHVPQVTTLPKDFDTRAVLFGTATQMGFDAIDLMKELPTSKRAEAGVPSDIDEGTKEPGPRDHRPLDEKDIEETPEEPNGPKEASLEEEPSDYFGFVKDSDIAKDTEHTEAYRKTQKTSFQHSHAFMQHADEYTQEVPEKVKDEETEGQALGFSLSGPAFFEGAKQVAARLRLPSFKRGGFAKVLAPLVASVTQGNKIIFAVPLVLALLVIAFVWYFTSVKATIGLSLTPKIVEQDQTVTFTTSGTTDTSSNTIAGQFVSVTEEGKVSGDATGTKDVGNKAKGTVTIFNSDSSSHTFPSGTTITSSNGLAFTLDKDVTVASGSSDPTNLSAGTADVPVTASNIGTDYNLPSGTKFSISGTSLIAAKNSTAFSGGSKKTITVVSQKDVDTLVDTLTKNLSSTATSDLAKQATSDTGVLPSFISTTVKSTTYDKKLGDEASSVTLDGSILFKSLSYKKADLQSFAQTVMEGQMPKDLVLAPKGISYDINNFTVKGDSAKGTLVMKAPLIPRLDTKTLASQVAGKSYASARDILSGIPQFSDATFTQSPDLFFLPKSLPRLSGNITFTVTTNE